MNGQMLACPHCAATVPGSARFCGRCGKAFGLQPAAEGGTATAPAPERRKTRSNHVNRVVVGIVVVLIAGAALWRSPELRGKLRLPTSWSLPMSFGGEQAAQPIQPSGPIVEVPPAILFRGKAPAAGAAASQASTAKPPAGDVVQAERDLVAHPGDPRILNDTGATVWAAGEKERGTELLSKAHAAAPDDPIISYNYARCLYDQGKLDEAVRLADEASLRQPQFDEAQLLLAIAALQKQNYAQADQRLQQVTSKVGALVLEVQGAIQLFQGKTTEALASFQQAAQLAGNNPAALYNLGLGHQQGGNLAQAAQYYRQAIKGNPDLAAAHHNLGTVLTVLDKMQEAFEEFHRAARLDPANTAFTQHLTNVSRGAESDDRIVGTWILQEGTMQLTGSIQGRPMSQSVAIPPGGQFTVTKTGSGTYVVDASAAGIQLTNVFRLQPDGSYRAPSKVPPELAQLLPPQVTHAGAVSFWVKGDTMFGDTDETMNGPAIALRGSTSWKASRARSAGNQGRSSPRTQ